MKKIEAIIRSSKFDEVHEALSRIGVSFFTFWEVKGFGQQRATETVYRGAVYDLGYIARTKLQILASDDKVEEIIDCITNSARTGEVGDGKILVTPLEQAIRIRTGERGRDAF